MKKKSQSDDAYVVVNKNPSNKGDGWTVDGEGRGWSYGQAEQFVKRCEYAERRIPYEIVAVSDVQRYVPSSKKKGADEAPEGEGELSASADGEYYGRVRTNEK